MSGQWFYRMFGEEFGPVPFEKLKDLAESGTIHGSDEVRSESANGWILASTVDGLGLDASQHDTMTATMSSTDFEMSTRSSGDEWYCLVAGAELGPLSFDELLKFAEHEQLSADDQVRLGATGKWRRAGSIGRLMAALPYKAHEKKIVPGAKRKPEPVRKNRAELAEDEIDFDSIQISSTSAARKVIPVPAAVPAPALPTPVAAASVPDVQATYRAAYEQAKAMVAESMLAQADAAYKIAEEQAMAQVSWTSAPNVDRYWWGWAGGVEFGPVEFTQVFGLAKSGQLKPSDFVRNGQLGQFVPSSGVPGLFKAIEMLGRATEARTLAKAQAQAAAALAAPAPAAPIELLRPVEKPAVMQTASVAAPVEPAAIAAAARRSNPAISTPAPAPAVPVAPRRSDPQVTARIPEPAQQLEPEPPAPAPAPVEPSRPAYNPYAASSGFSSSSSSAMSSYGSRPVPKPAPRRSSGPKSTWLPDLMEQLKEPKLLGSVGVVALIMLIFGWGYLPKSRAADIKMYNSLKGIVDEIRSKRTSAPNELPPLQQKLEATAKEIAAALVKKASRDEPAKQCLLWATRDEVPRLVSAGLGVESIHEKNLMARLQEAAYELGLEKRPPIDVAQLVTPSDD